MASVADYLKKREVERARAAVFDKNGLPTMNAAAIKLSCMEHEGYETPSLNEKLYLHFRGYRKIENLEEYPNVKTLFLESNGLRKIENIEHLKQLRCLYLHQNVIEEMSGLDTLSELRTLNLSQNKIAKISNLKGLEKLSTLNLGKNCLTNAEDLEGLLECPSITNLDLSSNNIDDVEIVEKVLKKMPKLSALYLKGNPCVRKIKHYRKTMLSTMPQLAYLDERPVFELERVAVKAWKEGGIEAEREARKQFQAKKINDDRQSMKTFRKWKEDRRAARKALIQKCKDEGKPVPKPKKYVSYRELSNEELDRLDSNNRALAKAERRAGDNPSDIKAVGREYWKERGAPVYDEDGNEIVEGTDSNKAPSPSANVSEKTTANVPKKATPTSSPPPPPAPSTTTSNAPPLPPAPAVQKQKTAEDIAKEKEQEEEKLRQEMEENERQNRVSESYRMYQQQRQRGGVNPLSAGQKSSKRDDGRLSYAQRIMKEQNELRNNKSKNTAKSLDEEERSLSTPEKEKLQQMVAEAEEEEDNYRSARSRMKQQAKERSSKSSNGWTPALDKKLQSAVLKHIFDFEKVAKDIGTTSEACRLRYAMLDRSRTDVGKPVNPLTQLVEKEAKRNKDNVIKQQNLPDKIVKSNQNNKYVKANANASDPFASFAASSSGISNVTVDFSKLPSMQDDDSSDDDEDVQPGIFASALRSTDIHKEIFGTNDENSIGGNGGDDDNNNMESTDVDGLD